MSATSQEVDGPKRGWFKVKKGELFFERVGRGAPICFLHGFGLDSRMWTPQLEAFQAEFNVIRYDLRGFGRSSQPPMDEYTHEDDLKSLLLHLGVKAADIIGLSMGGRMALRFAAVYPEMVRSLTLAATALDGYAWSSEWKNRWSAMCESAKAGHLADARRLWLEHPLFASARAIPSCGLLLSTMVNEYSGWHWRERDTAKAPAPPLADELQKITAPSLVITGSQDLPDFQAMGKLVAARIPSARSKRIEGSGHMLNLEAPDRFNNTLLEFWRELSK